jgi:hypothetical protein
MRRYATGLQLILLVCAGTASGYLWRAALHSQSTVAPTLLLQGRAPNWLFVKPQPAPPDSGARAQPKSSAQSGTRAKHSSQAESPQVIHRSTEVVSVATPEQVKAPTRAAVDTRRPPSRTKTPGRHPGRSRPAPPRTIAPPPPSSPPPPPPPTPPPPPPPPSPPPAPPPAKPVPAAPQPAKQAATSSSTRPGWGRGDRNHDHAGPPGQSDKGHSSHTDAPGQSGKGNSKK